MTDADLGSHKISLFVDKGNGLKDAEPNDTALSALSALLNAKPSGKFDYGLIDPTDRKVVQEAAEDVRRHIKAVGQSLFAAGERLVQVKKLIPHGHWCDWLLAEFSWSERTAQRYMRIADVLRSKSDILSDLDVGFLYTLAARSTPAEVRDEVVRGIENGEPVPMLPEVKGRIMAARKARGDPGLYEPHEDSLDSAMDQRLEMEAQGRRIEALADFLIEGLGKKKSRQLARMLQGIDADLLGKSLLKRLNLGVPPIGES